jgi:Protein of unknown function (DUF3078)
MRRSILFVFFSCIVFSTLAQAIVGEQIIKTDTITDTLTNFTPLTASQYIEDLLQKKSLWRPGGEELKYALQRLTDHYKEPFDSVKLELSEFNFDSIKIESKDFVHYDTLSTKWLNDSTFIFKSNKLTKEPYIYKEKIIKKRIDTSKHLSQNNAFKPESITDSVFFRQDTIREVFIDSLLLNKLNIKMYLSKDNETIPPLIKPGSRKSLQFLKDSSLMIADTTTLLVAGKNSPFYIVPDKGIPHSLKLAVNQLMDYTWKRDSIQLFLNDVNGHKTPIWLRAGVNDPKRYWLKNINNDSITIWIGNPDKYDISMFLEEEVSISRMSKLTLEDVPITTSKPNTALVKIKPLEEIPIYWEHELTSNLLLSQTFLSQNWAKGGESALSTLLDIKGTVNYTDKQSNTKWLNSGRLKYGSIITKENGMRTNTDMLEFNSQYNKLIKGKFDFSTLFYFKTQIAKGYKYTKDTAILTSKFLNPATFTIGLGVEYKPFKHTEINYSPLSYKNTFVLDDSIPRSKHGIPDGKKALQEMGSQLLITNKLSVLDGLSVDSKLRLFSSYFNNPQNIDVDWEVNLKRQINWYFTISANFQIIYDDDILFNVLDDDGNKVLKADGSEKKAPGLQFKEYMGLSFTFNF